MKKWLVFTSLTAVIFAAGQLLALDCKFENGNVVRFAQTTEIYRVIDVMSSKNDGKRECLYALGNTETGDLEIPLSDEANLSLLEN